MPNALRFHNLSPETSPWSQRVWIALEEKQINYTVHLHNKANKPKEFLQLYEVCGMFLDPSVARHASCGRPRLPYLADLSSHSAVNLAGPADGC